MKNLLLLLLAFSCASFAQEGADLYKQHCALCHENPQGHAPNIKALQAMNSAAILKALETGAMREQAKDLSAQQRATLASYLGSANQAASSIPASAPCAASTGSTSASSNAPGWNGFGASLTNARFQPAAAAGLSPSDVPKLRLKWAFGLGDVTVARGQPVVVGGRLFAATQVGRLYSLDARTGCMYWMFEAGSAIRSGVIVGAAGPSASHPAVFFADAAANAYAVDESTGKLLWKKHLDDHPAAMITLAPNFVDGVVYFGVSSLEELFGGKAEYECCTFRGSVVALEAATGAVIWKTYTISDPAKPTTKNSVGTQRYGPSGAPVWSTPTIDLKRNAIYVATGDNYSDPATATSDAVLALDRSTGKLLWSRQITANDAYNLSCYVPGKANCPDANGPDVDFGQPPILASLPNGKQVLVIGQKSGVAYGLDPDQQGKVLWQTRVGKGSSLGGSQWGSAADERSMYVAISDLAFRAAKDITDPRASQYELEPEKGGGLFALDLLSGKQTWSALPPPCGDRKGCSRAQPGAVSAIPGAVFEGSLDGHLRAYSSATGEVIWDFDTVRDFDTVNGPKAHGGALDGGGPAIAGGMVYAYSGYGQWGEIPGNVLLAFSVDGK